MLNALTNVRFWG